MAVRAASEADEDNDEDEENSPDPLIFPGLYAPSGMNIMSILASIANLVAILIRSRSRSRSSKISPSRHHFDPLPFPSRVFNNN